MRYLVTNGRLPLKLLTRTLLSIGVSMLLLALIFRLAASAGDELNIASVVDTLRRIALPLAGVYVLLQLLGAVFRAARFRVLLQAATSAPLPVFIHIYLATVVRNMAVDLLPARLGELAFAAMLNRRHRVPLDACIASLGVSVWFDLLVLAPIVAVLLLLPSGNVVSHGQILAMVVALALLAALGFWLIYHVLPAAAGYLQKHTAAVRSPTATKLVAFLDKFAVAVGSTRRRGVFARCVLLSLGARLCKYGGMYAIYIAVTAPSFAVMANVPLSGIMTALIASEATASLPIPAFMGFGSYEVGGVAALVALGYAAAESAITVFSVHVASQIVDYVLGGLAFVGFMFLGVQIASPERPPAAVRRRWAVAAASVLVLGIAFVIDQYRDYRAVRLNVPPPAGNPVAIAPQRQQRVTAALDGASGFVVWSSNRFGNHDILSMSLPDFQVRRLTIHPHAEYFPRISPDGTRIAFARSQPPWVSQRNPLLWDVYVLNLKTGRERLLARNATAPTWSHDGQYVYVQRNGGEFVQVDANSGANRLLMKSGTAPVPSKVILQTPSFDDESRQLAATYRGARRMTALLTLDGVERRVAKGCQLTWAPNGEFLYWVDRGGRQTNRIMRIDPHLGEARAWLDLPGRFSHEYFPKLSNDGRILVLGASASGHEHDVADYELFLWRVGEPASTAVRLTFHTGNDNWPDLYLHPR